MLDATPVPTGTIIAEGIFGMTLTIWTHKIDERGFTGLLSILDDTTPGGHDDLLAVPVTLPELAKLSNGLLDLLLGANGVGELAAGDIDKTTIILSDASAFTMEAHYMVEREYGEPTTHANGHVYSRIEEYEVAEIITITLNQATASVTIQLDIDEANRLYVNLAGLMFQHARALS